MNSFGHNIKITTYGESHGKSIGAIIVGIKPGIQIDFTKIKADLRLRKPQKRGDTKRIEDDEVFFTSGLLNGVTTGAAIHFYLKNQDVKSTDYDLFVNHFRPSTADFVANKKYLGFNDYRGGGIFSGRLTTLLVVAGSIVKQMMPFTYDTKLSVANQSTDQTIQTVIDEAAKIGDSLGGKITLTVKNMVVGLGEPPFYKLDGVLAMMLMSIPGVKGVMIGDGNLVEDLKGSAFNDLIIDEQGTTKTNHSGGINGGISNGNDLVLTVYVKPTPSIALPQATFNQKTKQIDELIIPGRHDTAFVRRLPIVVESVVALGLADFFFGSS